MAFGLSQSLTRVKSRAMEPEAKQFWMAGAEKS